MYVKYVPHRIFYVFAQLRPYRRFHFPVFSIFIKRGLCHRCCHGIGLLLGGFAKVVAEVTLVAVENKSACGHLVMHVSAGLCHHGCIFFGGHYN